jgi:hypothetical protein
MVAWLVTTKILYNDINLDNTGMNFPMVAGNVVALFLPIPITYFVSMMAPDDFDFTITQLGIEKVYIYIYICIIFVSFKFFWVWYFSSHIDNVLTQIIDK